jgi:hypothetical protein
MKQLQAKFIYGVSLCLVVSSFLEAKLTTLRHFDPAPNYSANDSMMPPNSEFIALHHARIKEEQPSKKRRWGINISGFWQKAVQARGYTGTTQYGTVVGAAPNAFELGDFRGTMYTMGLFLGRNPNNGRVIYDENYSDTDITNYVTPRSISCFGLPACLSNIANGLINTTCSGPTPTPNNDGCCPPTVVAAAPECPTNCTIGQALLFCPSGQSPVANNSISIFSPRKLAEDTIYFGAFSLPIEYQQTGLRFEFNFQFNDYIGLTVQTGASNIRQSYINTLGGPSAIPTSGTTSCTGSQICGQTNYGPYSLSDALGTNTNLNNLYQELNSLPLGSSTTSPSPFATTLFNQYISNNIAAILNPDCLSSDPICNFDKYSWDDIRAILTFSKSFEPYRARHEEDDDAGSWPDMILTPYGWIGGSAPVAKKTNYRNVLALPFGNDGHASLGGGVGFTFDFAESIEIGVEGGVTHFFDHAQTRPFPTHELQRILYPFETKVNAKPGMNWEFKALLHAYQFIKHVNFWFTYELIDHRRDCYTVCDSSIAQYFVPEVLTCRSDWRAQFFNAAVIFDIMPGLELSFVWQQPINPRNTYYPVSIMGSINFLF